MTEPTIRDVDALIGPATPHFAYQIRQRVENLVADLDDRIRSASTRESGWHCSTGWAGRRRRASGATHRARGDARGSPEWHVVVEAIARGDQVLTIRKGGIHEKPFAVAGTQFWLYPTWEHSSRPT